MIQAWEYHQQQSKMDNYVIYYYNQKYSKPKKNKMKSTLAKGALMLAITFLATTITTTGYPHGAIAWELLGITLLGTELIYLGKNAMFPSTSVQGDLNLRDVLSGLFIAFGSGLSSWAASHVMGTAVDLTSLLELMGTMLIGYLAKNVLSNAPKETPAIQTAAPNDKEISNKG